MRTSNPLIANDWASASVAMLVIAFVGALVLLVVWQIFAVIKHGMDKHGMDKHGMDKHGMEKNASGETQPARQHHGQR